MMRMQCWAWGSALGWSLTRSEQFNGMWVCVLPHLMTETERGLGVRADGQMGEPWFYGASGGIGCV